MSIEYRDILDCERVSDIPEDGCIPAIVDGDLKIISKKDAKFGGGSVTVYTTSQPEAVEQDAYERLKQAQDAYELLKEDGSVATVQEIRDAFYSGPVIIKDEPDSSGGEPMSVAVQIASSGGGSTRMSVVVLSMEEYIDFFGETVALALETFYGLFVIDPNGLLTNLK